MRFQCPNCKVVRSASERLLGREIRCPECDSPVLIPSMEEIQKAKQEKAAKAARAAKRAAKLAASYASAHHHPPKDAIVTNFHDEGAVEFRKKREPNPEDDMDMTPMVDVTFLLLIFFMITASFSMQKVIKTPAQKSQDPSTNAQPLETTDNDDLVTVQVDEFNAYTILTSDWEKMAASKQSLIGLLNDARRGDSSGNIPEKMVLQAHENCIHSAVVAALDAGRDAGFTTFQVSTVEEFD